MTTPSRLRVGLAFAAIYLLWGGTFLAIRYAVAEIPPLLTIAVRCAGGAAVLLAWLAIRGRLVAVPVRQWPRIVAAGTLLFLGCHGLLAWAERRVGSGEAALFMALIPLWLVVLDAWQQRRLPGRGVLLGLALGVGGVGTLVGPQLGGGSGGMAEVIGLAVSAFAWAAGSLVGRDRQGTIPVAQATALQLAAGSAVLLVAAVVAGETAAWSPGLVGARAAGALGFLILGGTVLGFGAYTWLLRVTTPAAVGTYAFVNPIVALGLAWVVGDGVPTARTALAAALIVAGVASTWGFGRRPRQRRAAGSRPRSGAGMEPALAFPRALVSRVAGVMAGR